jgi:Domain of unknown function (DUF5753)/Helix-turn-helix domain
MSTSGSPRVRHRRLASELRGLRERSGWSDEAVGNARGRSKAKVSRYELARSGLKPTEVKRLLDVYGVQGEHPEQALTEEATQKDWWEAYADVLTEEEPRFIGLTAETTAVLQCQINVTPGLLQTEQYVRDIFTGCQVVSRTVPAIIERRVEKRIIRQQVLTHDKPLDVTVVIDESVLHRQRGDRAVMRDQLRHLAKAAERPDATLRIPPLNGPKRLAIDSFQVLRFGQAYEAPLHDAMCAESLINYRYAEGGLRPTSSHWLSSRSRESLLSRRSPGSVSCIPPSSCRCYPQTPGSVDHCIGGRMIMVESCGSAYTSARAGVKGLDSPYGSQIPDTTRQVNQFELRKERTAVAGGQNSGVLRLHSLAVRLALVALFSSASVAAIAVLHSALVPSANIVSAIPLAQNSPIPSSPAGNQPSSTNTQTELQQLEILQLHQQTDKWATIRAWLPAGTALVAFLGAAVGIVTYFADARKGRRLRLEDKVEENIGVLIDYPADSTAGIGKLNNALRNLRALSRVAGSSSRSDIEQRVSRAIAEIVSYDLNLNDLRQARLDALALDSWLAYRRLLRKSGDLRDDIFFRYVTALRNARIARPGLYQTARIGPDGEYRFGKDIDDATLQHFGTLVASYRRHVNLVVNDSERRQRITAFGAALENQELAEQVFSTSSAQASGRP